MWRYIRRRLLLAVLTYWAVSTVVFGLLYLTGDPVAILLAGTPAGQTQLEELRHELGFDQPVPVQYLRFLAGAVRGDLGKSLRSGEPALLLVSRRIGFTVELAVLAMTLALVVSVPVGIVSAMCRGSLLDRTLMLLSMVGQSMPIFWVGLLMIAVFAVGLRWFPAGGAGGIEYLVLPAATLALYPLARITRLVRSSLVDVLGQDYILAARARGLWEALVVGKHALKNASLPVVTIVALQFGYMLGGAVITETIYGWPGIGHYTVTAIHERDFPVVQAAVVLASGMFIGLNFLVDLLYGWLDPRIRYT
ncbi:MAG TPA: ABC transporter permease [Candidatus Methylomirabilis sp.]|nr:ABC transporter permease [Candidatus Methylomirabilis sp.]